MNQIHSLKNQLMKLYSERSGYIDMIIRFCLAFILLTYLNKNLGYMESLNNMIVVLGISIICSFLPMGFLVVIATVVMIAHMYALSMVLAGCVALVYVGIYIIHFRFSSEYTVILLITPIACALHIPYVIPIAVGLLAAPLACVSISCGVVVYYLVEIVGQVSQELGGVEMTDMIHDALNFAMTFGKNMEMIALIIVLCITTGTVYIVKRIPMKYACEIACGCGAIVSLVTTLMIGYVVEFEYSMFKIFSANILGVLIGVIIAALFMAVDYKKTEVVQYEDDEYFYYVKAVPKLYTEENTESHKRNNRGNRRRLVDPKNEDYESDQSEVYGPENDELTDGETTIISSGEIERELRKNARDKHAAHGKSQKGHYEANYKLLEQELKRESKQK